VYGLKNAPTMPPLKNPHVVWVTSFVPNEKDSATSASRSEPYARRSRLWRFSPRDRVSGLHPGRAS
jgi:hypothetical protein